MSSSSTVQAIIFASQVYAISIYPMIFIAGLIGNFCNIMVFHYYKQFQVNQCAFYLMMESIANFALLIFPLPFRFTQFAFDCDLTSLSLVWCKLKQAIAAAFSILSFSTISYAAIDQYLSTNHSVHLRQLSTLKLPHRLIYITIFILIIYSIPFLIFSEINPIFGCTINNVGFEFFYSFIHFFVFSAILPLTISALFAALAYKNVRRIIRHQVPIMRRRLDRQLTAMVLTKVAFLVVTIVPFVIDRIYSETETVNPNNHVRIAIEQLIFNITTSLYYINFSVCKFPLLSFIFSIKFCFRVVSMYIL